MHTKNILKGGAPLTANSKALILLHGRGASPEDILSLAPHLHVEGFSLLAPRATNSTWYPYSFLSPPAQNEPWLSSALHVLQSVVDELAIGGLSTRNIYWLGFSQGACLALEFMARQSARFGGLAAFTGGLIGDRLYRENYTGDLQHTPVYIGTGDPDPHVPVQRVRETAALLEERGAIVTTQIYSSIGHTVTREELSEANRLIFASSAGQPQGE